MPPSWWWERSAFRVKSWSVENTGECWYRTVRYFGREEVSVNLGNNEIKDVTFVCDDGEVLAHRVILGDFSLLIGYSTPWDWSVVFMRHYPSYPPRWKLLSHYPSYSASMVMGEVGASLVEEFALSSKYSSQSICEVLSYQESTVCLWPYDAFI